MNGCHRKEKGFFVYLNGNFECGNGMRVNEVCIPCLDKLFGLIQESFVFGVDGVICFEG